MIEFMVVCAPRSASTWVANWLTTDTSLCFHDLSERVPPEQWNSYTECFGPRTYGVSDTGVMFCKDFLVKHPARKLIVHRDNDEINASIAAYGVQCHFDWQALLKELPGKHVHWRSLFERPAEIYEYLLGKPFDPLRHELLCDINVQPHTLKVNLALQLYRQTLHETRH